MTARSAAASPGGGAEADERYIVVDGRRWRATDPSIPGSFAAELVHELMAARRAVSTAGRTGVEVGPARARVHDAKMALGERGEPWWEPPSRAGRRRRTEAVIRALLWARDVASSICPSDVARVVGGGSWRSLMPTVRDVAAQLAGSGTIVVTQGDGAVDVATARGPVRLRRGPSWPDMVPPPPSAVRRRVGQTGPQRVRRDREQPS